MSKAFLGAYWGPRAESAERCAERVLDLIAGLRLIDEKLTNWRDTTDVDPQPLALLTLEELADRLRSGIALDDMGKVMGSLGYAIHWRNSDRAVPIALNVSLGGTSKLVSNAVLIQFPGVSAAPGMYSLESASALLSTVIGTFRPDRAVWLDDNLLAAQKEPDRVSPIGGIAVGNLVGYPAGWATYLTDAATVSFDRNLLPTEQ